MIRRALVVACMVAGIGTAWADCWDMVSQKYQLPVNLLRSIAAQESGFRNSAINTNKDGSRDVCMMQINSTHFPRLQREFGITEYELRTNACTCLDVAGWILWDNRQRLGASWDFVGAYNAASPEKRQAYAWKIYRRLFEPK